MITPELVHAILDQYTLNPEGVHGVLHWARVCENGVRLAEAEGANVDVVRLFAVFHDACRVDDGRDPDHGRRGAALAELLRDTHFELSESDFLRLTIACSRHTDTRFHEDLTVQCCFDADRLDLGRVGLWPDIRYLNTATAKNQRIRAWALERSQSKDVPSLVHDEWGVG